MNKMATNRTVDEIGHRAVDAANPDNFRLHHLAGLTCGPEFVS